MSDTDAVVAEQTNDDDAAFAAGFNEVTGNESAEVVETKPEEPVAEVQEEAPAAEPQQEAQPEETVTLNQQEVKALLGRLEELDKIKGGLRDLNGRYGSMSESLNRLKEARTSGGSVEITEEDLAELSDFGELKTSVSNVLKKVLSKAPGGAAAVDLTPVEQKFEQRLDETNKAIEGRILTAYHRDWKTVVASGDYQTWLATQPEDYRERISNSWNAEEIAESIDTFKSRKTQQKEAQQNKTRRLDAAVAHTGNARAAPGLDDDAAFLAGFKSVRNF